MTPTLRNLKVRHPALQASASSLPTSFDWNSGSTEALMTPVMDQRSCGSCTTCAQAGALSDRYAIQTKSNPVLDPLYVLQCMYQNPAYPNDDACMGDVVGDVAEFMERSGTTTSSCISFAGWSGASETGAQANAMLGACPTTCTNGSTLQLYTAQPGSTMSLQSVDAMKTEIYTNGPITTSFVLYDDFYDSSYTTGCWQSTNGVYIYGSYGKTPNNIVGYHSVVVTGWGVDPTFNQFWVARQSWGTSWKSYGSQPGYFKIGMYPQNQNIGFDVPITVSGSLYGGGLRALPNITPTTPSSTTMYVGVGAVLLLVLLVWFVTRKRK